MGLCKSAEFVEENHDLEPSSRLKKREEKTGFAFGYEVF